MVEFRRNLYPFEALKSLKEISQREGFAALENMKYRTAFARIHRNITQDEEFNDESGSLRNRHYRTETDEYISSDDSSDSLMRNQLNMISWFGDAMKHTSLMTCSIKDGILMSHLVKQSEDLEENVQIVDIAEWHLARPIDHPTIKSPFKV